MFDGELFGQQMVEIVRGYMDAELSTLKAENVELRARLTAIEGRSVVIPEKGEPGERGQQGEPGTVDMAAVKAMVDEAVLALPVAVAGKDGVPGEKGDTGQDGQQGEPGTVDMAAVKVMVDEAVLALPVAVAGKDGAPGEKGDTGQDGQQGEPGTVDMAAVKVMVDEAVLALPVAVAGKDGAPGEKGESGRDGVGLADALIDKAGALVLTLTDGRTKGLGVVIGKDGEPGRDGTDGKDGDTFTLDDFDIEPIGERAFKFKFTKGEVRHAFEFGFPVVLDRGVFTAERQYERGDAVTWAGSLWIAQKDTDAKPDTADSGWRLAVKRGRDGRNAN